MSAGIAHILGAALATLLLTSLFELLLAPRPRPLWRRPAAVIGVHAATTLLHFALWLLIVQRPWFAVVIAGSLQMVIVQVNNTKSASLREPFLCQDFEYFVDAVKHPRLYIPFFGIGLTIAASSAGALAIAAGFWLEPSLFTRPDAPWSLFVTLALSAASALALWLALPRLPTCTLEPNRDLVELGLYPYLWAYGRLLCQPLAAGGNAAAFPEPSTPPAKATLPHLVLVQSESFFDPRRWYPGIRPEILREFDTLSEQALAAGRFEVPAWGANTVRTECAVLTGLTPEALGGHRFNPYHQLARMPVRNLAGALKALGYRTVCVHPYPASFYLRDRVYPQLGFDDFIDIRAFDESDRDGQYTGDLALAAKVREMLATGPTQPLFVFLISMENHGPLHLETPDARVAADWLEGELPEGHGDLAVYLRHLHNGDQMLARLKALLTAADRPGMLAFYGDHVPIMPGVYADHGEPDGLTNYFIWQTDAAPSDKVRKTLSADKLGATLYQTIIERR
ncbi:LTA synthase family protein [Salinicola sp. DM10]|uniref:LTA synthase family protein n=1 Tax=Salinicola sp. DM10 TaxID=2815721 RepID=UPI001A8FF352|nr:LTA synthase family protein [Salinicola sp. DM10]MCE3025986.1 LTA synthase family protein [Salinicola sp. DM10]